ncbi:MAG TPA: hypothetical protein VFR06_02565 [Gallionellaceae bacterium]|nr:hypothetical protein [Gallionellaceae bacterium]
MFDQLSHSPFLIAALIFGIVGIILVVTGTVALFRAQILSFSVQALLSLLLIACGVISGMIAFGIQGYQALTREEVAARISVAPIAPQRFVAVFQFPDGRKARYTIAGDEIYVDARILKWQPIANIFGLHTSYELDRLGGRYRDINQELHAERTLYALGQPKQVDLFSLRERHTFLAPLLDAKYGSATYIPVTQAAELELRVSTTGLLMREILPRM